MRTQPATGATTLVWIDSEEAIIVRWEDRATVERVHSTVPGRHKSTGHVRVDPNVRHGGGGPSASAIDRERRERMRTFFVEVMAHVPEKDDVTVVGPGLVREKLERAIRQDDRDHRRVRRVHSQASERLTEHELVAHVRALAGDAPPRGMPDA